MLLDTQHLNVRFIKYQSIEILCVLRIFRERFVYASLNCPWYMTTITHVFIEI